MCGLNAAPCILIIGIIIVPILIADAGLEKVKNWWNNHGDKDSHDD